MRRWRAKPENRYREQYEAARAKGQPAERARLKALWAEQARQLYEMELGVAAYYSTSVDGGLKPWP